MSWKMSHSWIVRTVSAFALLLALQACKTENEPPPPPPKPSYTKEFLKSVLQSLTLEPLGPAGTAVEVLSNSPAGTKVFLKAWADSQLIKAVDMEQRTQGREKAKWEEQIQWYDAVSGCLGSGACGTLRRIQEQKERPKRPPPPPLYPSGGGSNAGGGHP
jgi:hypothetical protein